MGRAAGLTKTEMAVVEIVREAFRARQANPKQRAWMFIDRMAGALGIHEEPAPRSIITATPREAGDER